MQTVWGNDRMNLDLGYEAISLVLKDQYYNMGEIIQKKPESEESVSTSNRRILNAKILENSLAVQWTELLHFH